MATNIQIKRSAFQKLQGDIPDAEFARMIGVDRSHLWRVKEGKCSPGSQFVSKVLARFPKRKFDDLFKAV